MTGGELVETRLKQKLCIRCGVRDALKSPYLCDDCQKAIDRSRRIRERLATLPPAPRNPDRT